MIRKNGIRFWMTNRRPGVNELRYALSAREMQVCDRNTIEYFGISSLVLMERAALKLCDKIEELFTEETQKILIFAGRGNNGADALACARILYERGCQARIFLLGEETKCSEECKIQKKILERYRLPIENYSKDTELGEGPFLILDGIFGIGFNRQMEGIYAQAVEEINRLRKKEPLTRVLSIDIASGIHADSGQVCVPCVRADDTLTFAFAKIGQLLYPGAEYTGRLEIADIGITAASFLGVMPQASYLTERAIDLLPERSPSGNKGTFGKCAVIAGSDKISGAALLCAETCYRSGVGMVKVITSKENKEAVQTSLPEALSDFYSLTDGGKCNEELDLILAEAFEWATSLVIGPGIGTSRGAYHMVFKVLTEYTGPLIVDADALTLIASSDELKELLSRYRGGDRWVILTPHVKEFANLYGTSVADVKDHLVPYTLELAKRYGVCVICKDARSIIASCEMPGYAINVSGNCGMATAGSGDVLAGLLGALACLLLSPYRTATIGAYIHGKAGDLAKKELGEYYMLAGDMMKRIQRVLSE